MPSLATRHEGHVLVIEMQRPLLKNALSRALQHELVSAWQELEGNDDLWIAVLHGVGGVFSVGHDVPELARGEGDEADPEPVTGLFPLELSRPVIAAVEGPCYGLGFELALACDLRIAAEGARFGFPDQHLFTSHKVASVLLPHMASLGIGLDLLFTGKTLDARRAEEVRLVNKIVPEGQALAEGVAAARDMAQRFGSAEAFQKQAIWGFPGLPLSTALNLARRM
ncbi:MAG: enoyl-CoA hydratase/isomerase family protein [Chloroflexi bacterium]|nr:enoyl-CoA hydratase/isomerase family protein [Chloroflexota bacterium]